MANLMICTPEWSDAAILTASSNGSNFPVSGLQRKQLYNTWRPLSLTSWLVADLGVARAVTAIGLITCAARQSEDGLPRGTASASATWRIRAAAAEEDLVSSPGYDTGTIPFRQPGAEDDMLVICGFHGPAAAQSWRWWRIDFSDAGNAAGHVDFGRLYISGDTPFEINADWGFDVGFEDPTANSRSVSGAVHGDRREPYPYMQFAVSYGTAVEMLGVALRRDRMRGTSRDVLAIMDHEDAGYAAQTTVYGIQSQLSPVKFPFSGRYAKRFRIEGINP